MSHFIRIEDCFASYVGIDLHTTSLTLTAIGARGDAFERRGIPTHCTGLLKQFILSLPRPVCVGIESMGSFYWLWDFLQPRVDHLVLLDALDLSKLRPREAATDRTISARIAHCLRDGEVPMAYVPPPAIRRLRQLGRQWHRVTEASATAKVQSRWLLHQVNARGPRQIDGASMQRWLRAYGHDLEPLPCALLEHWHETILMYERIRVDLRRRMLGIVRADEVLMRHLNLLMSPRGIGEILGVIILAEFGDFHRFGNADAVACWTGLTERSHVSNRQKYPGQISKAGSATLRWALCEAAFQLNCSDETFHEQYERVKRKTSVPGKARVTMARRLARCLWKVVVSETPFRVGPSRNREARANEVRLRRKRRQQKRVCETMGEIDTMDTIVK